MSDEQKIPLKRWLVEQVHVSTTLVDVEAATREDARLLTLGIKRTGRVISRTKYAASQKHAERVFIAPPEHVAAHPVDDAGAPTSPSWATRARRVA